MLNAKFKNSYPSKKVANTTVFVYRITGGKTADIEQFKTDQGANLRMEGNDPLFFTTQGMGTEVKLVRTSKGSWTIDTSELLMLESMVKKFGGNLGNTIASAGIAALFGGSAPKPNVENEKTSAETDVDGF